MSPPVHWFASWMLSGTGLGQYWAELAVGNSSQISYMGGGNPRPCTTIAVSMICINMTSHPEIPASHVLLVVSAVLFIARLNDGLSLCICFAFYFNGLHSLWSVSLTELNFLELDSKAIQFVVSQEIFMF